MRGARGGLHRVSQCVQTLFERGDRNILGRGWWIGLAKVLDTGLWLQLLLCDTQPVVEGEC